jgi:hypothetical protein
MVEPTCHAAPSEAVKPPADARELIQKVFGVKRVAAWCEVDAATPYQWLTRSTEDNPIPPAYVPKIVAGARAAKIEFDVGLLWPAMRGLL